jgi:tagatose-6-phosphate ketose/aldose isomerase
LTGWGNTFTIEGGLFRGIVRRTLTSISRLPDRKDDAGIAGGVHHTPCGVPGPGGRSEERGVDSDTDTALTALLKISSREKKRRGLQYTPDEIHDQVDLWTDTHRRVAGRLDEIRSFLQPLRAEARSVCMLTGAGTSEFIGYCVEGLFRRALGLPVNVFSTTRIVTHPDDLLVRGLRTLMVSFARSGNSPESVGAVRIADGAAPSGSLRHLVVTCNRGGDLYREMESRENGFVLDLHPKTNDRGLAMTASFSNMVVAAQAVAHAFDFEPTARWVEELTACGKRLLRSAPDVIEEVCGLDFDRAVFLGSGSNFGTAVESHLKLQELTAGTVMCTYDTFPGLRHGPEAVIRDRTLVVAFLSRDPYVRRYEIDLLEEIREKGLGMATLVSCDRAVDAVRGLAQFFVEYDPESLSDIPDSLTPPVQVIIGQLLGLFRSIRLGFSPDAPSESGVINRVVEGVRVYDPRRFRERGSFDIIAER